ncbi:MAG TPA: 4-hydroxy-tetrahydrodipicolinate reductase [Promineifilum sp.]|nr:4-hydroxy-tetrahydrodipicolinate reductase [Promineifilum sp.]
MTIKLILAGATGWVGSTLALHVARTDDIELVAAVSRSHARKKLGDVLGESRLRDCPIYATAEEALAAHEADVFLDYTNPEVAKSNVMAALAHGANVVVGTSGLTDADYAEIGAAAEARGRAALGVGNFALTAVLLMKFAEMAARLIPQWEIIDYASDGKPDAPSGTVRELAARLGNIRPSELTVPIEKTQGVVATRGARMTGSQVHSIRLPSFVISAEVIFGMTDQKLTIRHDSGSSAEPYVDGALLAIRQVGTFTGLRRGLDSVLEL